MRLEVKNGIGCCEYHTLGYSCATTFAITTASPTSLNEFDANRNLVFDVDRNMPLDIVFDEGLIRNTYRPDGVCRIGFTPQSYSTARLPALNASKRICPANSLRISKKTSKKVYDGKGRLTTNETYLGNLVLNFGVPSQILHHEGVVDVSNLNQPLVHYHLKDHLGNVRAVVNPSATNTALISQTNDYYPFGMCYTKNPGSFTNKRKYNGKEEQEIPGRWLDYGARFYNPQLGRWSGVDPLAEKYRRWTPYNYCVNNPMRFVDPDGMGIVDANGNPVTVMQDKTGKYNGTFTFEKGTSQNVQDQFMANGGLLLKEMITIETGVEYITAAVASEEKIHHSISGAAPEHNSEDGNLRLAGTTDVRGTDGSIEKTEITIYRGSIEKSMENGNLDNRLSVEQNMASRAVHETNHATKKDDIKVRREQGYGAMSKEQHQNAYNAGSKANLEFQLLKGLLK